MVAPYSTQIDNFALYEELKTLTYNYRQLYFINVKVAIALEVGLLNI